MEHLKRIIPKIDVLHGLPGVLTMCKLTMLYLKYLSKNSKKYKQLYEDYTFYTNLEEALKNSKYSLFTRPHLPNEIIDEFRNLVPNLKNIKIKEVSGLYKYVLRNYTHIPEIDKNLVSLIFEETLEEVKCRFEEGICKPVDISVFEFSRRDLLLILARYRNYKILDHYLAMGQNALLLDALSIPVQFIEEYAKRGGDILDKFADKTKLYIHLNRTVRGIDVQLAGGPPIYIEMFEMEDLQDFTFNAHWYNFKNRTPTDLRMFWRTNFGENLAEYKCFKNICNTSCILHTSNLKVVQLALKIYPNKFRTIEWVFANFDFYPQKNEYQNLKKKTSKKNGTFTPNNSKDWCSSWIAWNTIHAKYNCQVYQISCKIYRKV